MYSKDKVYGILGLARSGIAAAKKIKELGGQAFLSDLQPAEKIKEALALQQDFDVEFGGHTDRLLDCDEWIVSPGIPLNAPIIEKGRTKGIPMISEIEFGYQIMHPETKIIAVTGSNGKSTTASLIYHMLNKLDKRVILAGNIGDAFCNYDIHKSYYEYIVLEISSFQLDLIQTFKPKVAVLLNITPDHLNRYESFGHYALSKFRLFENQGADDFAILNTELEAYPEQLSALKSKALWFSQRNSHAGIDAWVDSKFINFGAKAKVSVYDISLRGPHNHLNMMAAVLAVNSLERGMERVLKSINGFKPLVHRLEPVGSVNGVYFYNDSKATNTDSVRSALQSFDTPLRVIMGGSDKGEDFNCLTDILKEKATKLYITGETSGKMRQAWLGKIPLVCLDTMADCVKMAFDESMVGDTVLLSPGCASYDQFRNFEHRGQVFKQVVEEISWEHEKN
ncbi:MAG: UDP-N-acetylmuramoyl-L-alanine--D-glutamate ligase [Candidatus Cloacimonadota bacterium]